MPEGTFQEQSRVHHDTGFGLRIGEAVRSAPDGRRLRRTFLHTSQVVAVVAVDRSDLLLVNEYRAAVGQEVLRLPMGKLADGEAPLAAARRELYPIQPAPTERQRLVAVTEVVRG